MLIIVHPVAAHVGEQFSTTSPGKGRASWRAAKKRKTRGWMGGRIKKNRRNPTYGLNHEFWLKSDLGFKESVKRHRGWRGGETARLRGANDDPLGLR